jgi:hypothetical protein
MYMEILDDASTDATQLFAASVHTCGVAAAGSTAEGNPKRGEPRESERVAIYEAVLMSKVFIKPMHHILIPIFFAEFYKASARNKNVKDGSDDA